METTSVKWKLHAYLKSHNLTAYAIAKETGARMSTIYRLAQEGHEPDRVDLPTLGRVITGLRKLTGAPVELADIFEVVEETVPTLPSLKPGEVGDDKLRSTPARGKFNPRGPQITARGGKTLSEIIVQEREERAQAIAGSGKKKS